MKTNKIEIIGSFLIIGILIIMMVYALICSGIPKLLQKLNMLDNNSLKFFQIENSQFVNIDYSEIYPFKNQKVQKTNVIKKYENNVQKIKEKIEKISSEKLLGYEKLVELSYIYNNLISYNLVSNTDENARISLENGYFSRIVPKYNMQENAKRLINFNDYLEKQKIDFLYIQAPYKISKKQSLSSIYKDYSNENIDELLTYLDRKVNYIDLRKIIEQKGLNQLQLFYKTDHHWLPETGLWSTQIISKYLNENYNMDLKINNIDKNNYNYKVYKDTYLGSDGRYVSLANAELENFTLIMPKFNTKLNVKILDAKINKTDTFENTLINWSKLEKKNYYKMDQYAAYAYGTRPLIEIHNKLINNNKKILLIRDSFSNVVVPFLSLENEYLSVIDLRYFNGSLKNYINHFSPDIVIVMYNGNILTNLTSNDNDIKINMWNFD